MSAGFPGTPGRRPAGGGPSAPCQAQDGCACLRLLHFGEPVATADGARTTASQQPPPFVFLVLVNRRRYFLFVFLVWLVWFFVLFIWLGLVELGFDLQCECECPLR